MARLAKLEKFADWQMARYVRLDLKALLTLVDSCAQGNLIQVHESEGKEPTDR